MDSNAVPYEKDLEQFDEELLRDPEYQEKWDNYVKSFFKLTNYVLDIKLLLDFDKCFSDMSIIIKKHALKRCFNNNK